MTEQEKYIENQIERLANRIKQLRKEKGYSSAEKFAYANDINRVQYGRYENGVDLRFSSLLRVLDGLDVSLEEFFGEGFGKEVEEC